MASAGSEVTLAPYVESRMKLRIEPLEAKSESYSGAVQVPARVGNIGVLDLSVSRQELPKWCWAAIAGSMGRYYGTGLWPQHEVARAVLGCDCSRFREDEELRARCDAYAMLDDALRLTGCYSHWSPGRPTFERLRAEIVAGRPACLQIDWYRGGAHYVVLTGYYDDTGEVYIQDPLHGPSVQDFASYPRHYCGIGGVWAGTFWTCPPLDQLRARC